MIVRSLLLFLAIALPTTSSFAADEADAIFGLDKVWSIHLTIQPEDWKKMQPTNRTGPFGPPAAKEAPKTPPAPSDPDRKAHGLFAYDFAYVKTTVEIGGATYTNAAVRFKGSGTYISTQGRLKRPLKIELDRYVQGQHFHGLKKLTLNNNAMDATAVREVLAYSVFRVLDVPAPRTAYAVLTLTIPGQYEKEYVGLYVLAESVDKSFLKKHFGSSKGLLLKPERVGPLEYLGEDWPAYEKRYQAKSDANKKAHRRLIEFTKLIQTADDKSFAQQIGDYLDVDEFLRFLAANVALSSMDSFIGMGRNFYLYLNPKTDKFAFIPWDVDLAFGAFLVVGTPEALMNLSIRKPYPGQNRLIERLLADKATYALYCHHLQTAVTRGMTAEGVKKDLRAITAAITPISEKEKKAAVLRKEPANPAFNGMFSRAPQPDAFVVRRVASIKGQLAGTEKGSEVKFGFTAPPGGFGPGQFLLKPILSGADKDKDGKLSKEETAHAAKALFRLLDKEGKGQVDQKTVAAGLNRLIPGPTFPGGRPPANFPTLGELLAKPIMERAGKDGHLRESALIAALNTFFAQSDKNKDGKLDDTEIRTAVNSVLVPPRVPAPAAPAKPPPKQQ